MKEGEFVVFPFSSCRLNSSVSYCFDVLHRLLVGVPMLLLCSVLCRPTDPMHMLALLASFWVTYSFESLTQNEASCANFNVEKILFKSPPFMHWVYSVMFCQMEM